MALPRMTTDLDVVQKLDNEPNDVGGLSAEELKAKFDEAPNAVKTWINNTLLPFLESTAAAKNFGIETLDGLDTPENVQQALQAIVTEMQNITAGAVADGSINSDKLASSAVIAAKIANSAVTAAKLATGAVTEAKLASNAVTTNKILDGAVTAAKLAPGAIPGVTIEDGSITAAKIANGAVNSDKLGSYAVTTAKIASKAVATAKLADGAVTTVKLADGAVTSAKIASGGVETANLASSAVTAEKIAEEAVSKVYTGRLTADGWTAGTGWYSQVFNDSGILAADEPIIDVTPESPYTTGQAQDEEWGKIYKATTAAGKITFYASEEPTVDLPFKARCIRK